MNGKQNMMKIPANLMKGANGVLRKKHRRQEINHIGGFMKRLMIIGMVLALPFVSGCANMKATGATISNAALTAPVLAYALDDVYEKLIKAKAVPDHQIIATFWLEHLDAVAPMVHELGENLAGDDFSWASLIINAAIAAAKVMGYWL